MKLFYSIELQKITLNRKELKLYKLNLYLTQEQKDIIVGCCLGDLYIRQLSALESRLIFEQKNEEYLFHLYSIFKDFVRTEPKLRERLRKGSLNKS